MSDRRAGGVAGPLLAALALGLCCGLPAVIAGGALGVAAGLVARAWPLVLVGALVAGYAITRWIRRARAIRSRSRTP